MKRTIAGVLVAGLLAAAGITGTSTMAAGTEQVMVGTHVLVFIVEPSSFTIQYKDKRGCSGDCEPDGKGVGKAFKVLGIVPDRGYGSVMFSPRWQQPRLETAQEWATCLLNSLEKHPKHGRVPVTNAYLIRVEVPVSRGERLQPTQVKNPCVWD